MRQGAQVFGTLQVSEAGEGGGWGKAEWDRDAGRGRERQAPGLLGKT